MAAHGYDDLRLHIGHSIVCVGYAGGHAAGVTTSIGPDNVAIECEDCGIVLLDFDRPSWRWRCPNDCANPRPAWWPPPPGEQAPPCSNCDAPLEAVS